MMDYIKLVSSTKFLSGASEHSERDFSFPKKKPFRWQVVDVAVFAKSADAIHESPNQIAALEDPCLGVYRGVYGQIMSVGCGELVDAAKAKRNELSEVLSESSQIQGLAERISAEASLDIEAVSALISEMPYGQLAPAMLMDFLVPSVTFPLLTVLVDAYGEGLFPFGIFNGMFDRNYVGPDIILCLDPSNLRQAATGDLGGKL